MASVLYGTRRKDIETASAQFAGPDAYTIAGTRTAWFIARDRYNDPTTIYTFPDGKKIAGDQIKDWDKIPGGTKVKVADFQSPELFEGFKEVVQEGTHARLIAGDSYNKETTIYFLQDRRVRTGSELDNRTLENLAAGTKILVGYTYGGHVSLERSPFSILKEKWNYPSTFYRFPDGKIASGDEIDSKTIPKGTLILFRN